MYTIQKLNVEPFPSYIHCRLWQ